MQRYNPKEIEPKWQAKWEADKIYQADMQSDKPKYIGFGMFNYPSGAGIHIGHGKNFTLPDVLVRSKRQQGYEAYSPVGFDSFGLPAENYAIRTGTPPRETTDKAIANYRMQYRAMGWSQDWSKEIDTSTPEYYRWTQWIFTKLFEHGLAYQKESPQWWCPQDMTVLANEQVEAGKCWRCGHVVEKKLLKQWFFKITDYADEILDATDALDWTESVKTQQKNWIGRSVGAEISWQVCDKAGVETGVTFKTFTTRKDTIPGVTFIVIAPESELLDALSAPDHIARVHSYRQSVISMTDVDRQGDKEKSGVFSGAYAKNPFNSQAIPIYAASYVLAGYGTGVVMGMPGHDLRDREFSIKHDIPVVLTTTVPDSYQDLHSTMVWNGTGAQMNSGPEYDGLDNIEAGNRIFDKLIAAGKAEARVNYKMRDWLISRQRYWGAPIPIIHCPEHGAVAVPADQLPVVLPDLKNFEPSNSQENAGRSPLAKVTDFVQTTCPTCGGPAERETDTMDGYACSSWYFLRYIDPHNDSAAWDSELVKKWMPVDFYNGGDHAIAHLLYARFFMRFFHKIGLVDTPEPFKRMYYHAKIMAPDGTAFSKTKGNGPDPLKLINAGYGADSIRTYIMFISPADMESPWSEDGVPGCYRFLQRIWTLTQDFLAYIATKSLPATTNDAPNATTNVSLAGDSPLGTACDVERVIHKTIKKVTEDIEAIKFNTAIAAMMECVNDLYKLKLNPIDPRSSVDSQSAGQVANESNFGATADWRFAIEALLQLVAPFAPYMSEELWHQLGHQDTIHVDHWPVYDAQYLVEDTMTIVVQINGKLRAQLAFVADASKELIVTSAEHDDKVLPYLDGHEVKKTIYVPGKLVNFVI